MFGREHFTTSLRLYPLTHPLISAIVLAWRFMGCIMKTEELTKDDNLREIISRNRDTKTILMDGIKATYELEQKHHEAEQPHWMVEMYTTVLWCVRYDPDAFASNLSKTQIKLRKCDNYEYLLVVKYLYNGAGYDTDDEKDRNALSHRQRYLAYGFAYCSSLDMTPEQFEQAFKDGKFTTFSKLQQEAISEAKPKRTATIKDDNADGIGEDADEEEDDEEDGDTGGVAHAPSNFVAGVVIGDKFTLSILRDLLAAAMPSEANETRHAAMQATWIEIDAYLKFNFPPDDGGGTKSPVTDWIDKTEDDQEATEAPAEPSNFVTPQNAEPAESANYWANTPADAIRVDEVPSNAEALEFINDYRNASLRRYLDRDYTTADHIVNAFTYYPDADNKVYSPSYIAGVLEYGLSTNRLFKWEDGTISYHQENPKFYAEYSKHLKIGAAVETSHRTCDTLEDAIAFASPKQTDRFAYSIVYERTEMKPLNSYINTNAINTMKAWLKDNYKVVKRFGKKPKG